MRIVKIIFHDIILAKLPGDAEPAAKAFRFEREHENLFRGTPVFRCGVYFSEETRRHSCFGSFAEGYTSDFSQVMDLLFRNGLLPGAATEIPEGPDTFPLLILASVIRFTREELIRLERYRNAGGKLVILGPTGFPGIHCPWNAPSRPAKPVWESWSDWHGVWGTPLPPVEAERRWSEPAPGVHYHPCRLRDSSELAGELLNLIRRIPAPGAEVLSARGFFTSAFRDGETIRLFFVAGEYAVKVDAELDAMRFHRSRVNLFTEAPPCGQDGLITLRTVPGMRLSSVVSPPDSRPLEWTPEGRIEFKGPRVLILAELHAESGTMPGH